MKTLWEKEQNVGNEHFLLFFHMSSTIPKLNLIFQSIHFFHQQIFSIWTISSANANLDQSKNFVIGDKSKYIAKLLQDDKFSKAKIKEHLQDRNN